MDNNNQTSVVIYPRLIKSDNPHTTVLSAAKHVNLSSGLNSPVTPHYIPPRAPIVLCHGLYGFDKLGPDALPLFQIHYWGGIENALAKLGAKVIGGLDCRYLITHILNRPYKINSLMTISTPHRGSPVMDWFRDHVGVGTMAATAAKLTENDKNKFINQFVRLVDTEAYANLSTDYCKHYFNPHTPNDPHISYYSYGAVASFPSWSLLNIPSKWIQEKEGDNDGLVSVESAKWGKYVRTLNADHWDLNGQR
ncbi:MAG: hypothetical protein EXX96DRAFT_488567 [Benjaminiella poitrasii]|nr:MAG: hypothetical protein EXX96DRAFT_488567 [Benjaminiella poitrasii]